MTRVIVPIAGTASLEFDSDVTRDEIIDYLQAQESVLITAITSLVYAGTVTISPFRPPLFEEDGDSLVEIDLHFEKD